MSELDALLIQWITASSVLFMMPLNGMIASKAACHREEGFQIGLDQTKSGEGEGRAIVVM